MAVSLSSEAYYVTLTCELDGAHLCTHVIRCASEDFIEYTSEHQLSPVIWPAVQQQCCILQACSPSREVPRQGSAPYEHVAGHKPLVGGDVLHGGIVHAQQQLRTHGGCTLCGTFIR